jgi:glycosyltransferase involved in cell wall biosynthesis
VPHTVVHYVDGVQFGGTEQIVLSLLSGLDPRTWRPVLFHHREPGIRPLVERARAIGVATRELPTMQGPDAVRALPAFVRGVREERPTIFHAHLSWLLSCKFGLLGARAARVPAVVATLQQFLVPPWRPNVYWQQRVMGSVVHRYVAVARAVADQLIGSFRMRADRVEVIHNSIPVDASEDTEPWEPRQPPTVLTVARLDAQKGLRYLLDAIASVPDARLVLVGEGPERHVLEEHARRLGVSGRVDFLGQRSDVPRLLSGCDVFVLPSIYEGFPLAVLEAMEAGKPVVATAVGGTPEAVLDGETGYLVPPRDPAALAAAIRRVLTDPVRTATMGEAARQRVRSRFSRDAMIDEYRDLYERLVRSHR